ncbi:hypothetical protein HaLaN_21360 [Haematococcus lacustris]|uniref:Uncharacterized protein n=1 Tax=Haematococcus lacustris TaxID=44745 RepID=A0A699ZP52_HAELA|nr:hypothetical protein HaLaN_21360 [Haematococcus lacustris]
MAKQGHGQLFPLHAIPPCHPATHAIPLHAFHYIAHAHLLGLFLQRTLPGFPAARAAAVPTWSPVIAAEQAALVNHAYTVLKKPLYRANYLGHVSSVCVITLSNDMEVARGVVAFITS